jgi:hypothetical protein
MIYIKAVFFVLKWAWIGKADAKKIATLHLIGSNSSLPHHGINGSTECLGVRP